MKRVFVIVENGPEAPKRPIMDRVLEAARLLEPEVRVMFVRHELTPDDQNTWFKDVFPAENIVVCDLRSLDAARDAIQDALRNGEGIAGVYTYLEEAVEITNSLAHHFDVPAICSGRDASPVRRKDLMRAAVRTALRGYRDDASSNEFVDAFDVQGVPLRQPRWGTSSSFETALQQWEAWRGAGRTAIIKPVAMGSSLGVKAVPPETAEERFAEMWRNAARVDFEDELLRMQYEITRDVLLETLISHDAEISVEAIVSDGAVRVVAISRKYVAPWGRVDFEEMAHLVGRGDETERARMEGVLTPIVAGLALRNTAVHAEFLVDGDVLSFVELGARLGGDLIPVAVQDATGLEFVGQSVAVALGRACSWDISDARYVAIVKFCEDTSRAVEWSEEIEAYHPRPGGPLFLRAPNRRVLEDALRRVAHS